jgi:ATP-dependent exoDNAse (exonuclease V) alpha subunit
MNENTGRRKTAKDQSKLSRFEPGSEEQAQMLAAGYGFGEEEAKEIIKNYEGDNVSRIPYDVFMKAKAYMKALYATPSVITKTPMWERSDEYDG